MLETSRLACSYVDGMGKSEFLADRRTQQAVIMNIVVMGEAATKLLKEQPAIADACPEVPWKSMKGMRNRVAHGYFDIDLDIVWEPVQSALPQLLQLLPTIRERIRQQAPGSESG